MTTTDDHPGGTAAVACGCSCPTDQPGAHRQVFRADPGCPVHGLHMVAALLDEEGAR